MRSVSIRILAALLWLACAPAVAFAQEEYERDSPWMEVLFTWTPVLVIAGLWLYFMRKLGMGKKGPNSYQGYMKTSQERLEQIEHHLASIAKSLAEITAHLKSRDRLP
jgi:ATP-dependent Zn protease